MILVTGSNGFVGSHIVKELTSQQREVRCLVRQTSNLRRLAGLRVEISYGDITQPATLSEPMKNVDTVIHLAAIIRETGKATFEQVNYLGTKNIITAAKQAKVGRIIYFSNLGATPDPHYPFLRSKWLAEEEIKGSGLAYTIFRPSIIFGEDDNFINLLAKIARLTPVVPIIGSGRTKFQLISIENVVHCVIQSLGDKKTINQLIPLGGPEHLTYDQIVDTVIRKLKLRRLKIYIPVFALKPVVWVMERLMSHPPLTSAELAMLNLNNVTNLDAVSSVFSFTPQRLSEGITWLDHPKGQA